MITQEEAEAATQYLIDSASAVARARAEVTRTDNMLRHVKALAMKASGQNAVSAQEREAYAHDKYRAAIEANADAVEKYECLKAEREGYSAIIEMWRSINASQKQAERGYGSARR